LCFDDIVNVAQITLTSRRYLINRFDSLHLFV
jgi:hypothetical protein